MLKAAFKSLLGRKLRLLMSTFAIVLGVAFVAGSLIFTDSLQRTFDDITKGSVPDVSVTADQDADASGYGGPQPTLTPQDVKTVSEVEGVKSATGEVSTAMAFVMTKDGKVLGGQGPPGIGVNFHSEPAMGGIEGLRIVEGREPKGPDEVALDEGTLEKGGYQVGDTAMMVVPSEPEPIKLTIVGEVKFSAGMGGASLSALSVEGMQKYFAGGKDVYTSIWVVLEPGFTQKQVTDAINDVVRDGVRAHEGEEVAEETQAQIREVTQFMSIFLLVFAGIALIVGSFLIINTFSILVAQRSRELALFRAMGASRGQVTRSVLFEALIVGFIGGLLGLGLGYLLAQGIRLLMAAFGLEIAAALVVLPTTIIVSLVIGVGVTVFAALLPARRASKVAPVEALSDAVSVPEGSLRWRLAAGIGLIVLGGGLILLGLLTDIGNSFALAGGGMVLVLFGALMSSPVVGRPVVGALGWVYDRMFGFVGRLASTNSLRNPRRTAATAAALMIGMALVVTMAVVGQSMKSSLSEAVDTDLESDFTISNAMGLPFAPGVADRAERVDGVEQVARIRGLVSTVNGDSTYLTGMDASEVGVMFTQTPVEGSVEEYKDDTAAISQDYAKDNGVGVGDTLEFKANGKTLSLPVAVVLDQTDAFGMQVMVPSATMTELGAPAELSMVAVRAADSADHEAVRAGLEEATGGNPLLAVQDREDLTEMASSQVDQMLMFIYGLLGLAIIIAVLGIVNTLALSVMERTREIGLLRAVGMERRQVRRMVSLESVVMAVLGAVLGTGLGLVFGVVLQRLARDQGLTTLVVPWVQIVAFLVAAVIVGLLAAVWPAFRAGRMNVLRAISTE